ncbi:MAG: bifunctional 4-hydroxy-2-oxoglutarate aldolase/2-dehydro-3-deoxy-phosphogluconate aldolase [Chloroflexota bacterium]
MPTDRPSAGRPALPAQLTEGRIVAIGRRLDPSLVDGVGDALLAAGIGCFEITLNEPEADALGSIGLLARRFAGRLLVGAGTVMSIGAAERAIDAGATFIVSPHTDEALVAWAAARGVPAFPGALTPTEVVRAWNAGAAGVKLFPASAVGPSFIRELRGPLPGVPIVPTGGVSADNAGDFVRAGAVAVGLGSWLIGDGSPDGVRERGLRVRAAIDAAAA